MLSKRLLPPAALVLTIACTLAGCSKNSSTEVEYIPVQLTEGGAWTFINDKGECISTQEWEFEPTVTYEGIFTARTDSGLTVYRWDGTEAKPVESLRNLASVGIYNEGLLPVSPDMERIHIVDRDGDTKFVLEPVNGQEITSCDAKFHDGLLIFHTINGKSGVVDKKGKIVVEPKYTDISSYCGGYALAMNYSWKTDNGPSYFVLDKDGKETPVKGKFGFFEEGECGPDVPSFTKDGYADVFGEMDTVKYECEQLRITTDGKVMKRKKDDMSYTEELPDGYKLIHYYGETKRAPELTDAEGKLIMKFPEDIYPNTSYPELNYISVSTDSCTKVYDYKGERIYTADESATVLSPGGKFGPILSYNDDGMSFFTLLNEKGDKIGADKYYGVGVSYIVDLSLDEIDCNYGQVISAYVDLTAAATKISSMATSGTVKGKGSYYVGQSVKDILSGENANYYNGSDRTVYLPTGSDGNLACGAGFWISGTAHSSTKLVAPTYQKYFEVHHYDYRGVAWGWNRVRQTGVKFNPAAKVQYFDLQLHTNYPSGMKLREAIGRRLKNEGYTQTGSYDNYDEYSNSYSDIIIYGSPESRGVGAITGAKRSDLSAAEKSSLAASI